MAANRAPGDAKPREIEISHGGHRYAALAWGPADDPAETPGILALHGWLDNAMSFHRIAPALGLPVVALDLPGHGLSPHRNGGFYHFVEYVLDVAAAAEGLGWPRFDLLGHSLGAGVATLFAGAFPGRIRRLALIEGLGALTTEPEALPGAVAQAWAGSEALRSKTPPSYESAGDAARARAAVGSGLSLGIDAARALCERGLRREDGRWVWRSDPRLTLPSPQRLTEAQTLAFIRAIEAPTLVIRALGGLPFDDARMRERVAATADLTMVEIEGGHHLHMESSWPAVAEAIRQHFSPDGEVPQY